MSDVGGGLVTDVADANLTLDDEATNSLPDEPANTEPITTGTYKPTQGITSGLNGDNPVPANFPSPAPIGPYAKNHSASDGTNPNGSWKLYVLDDSPIEGDSSRAGGLSG
jgi:hypothetical protein